MSVGHGAVLLRLTGTFKFFLMGGAIPINVERWRVREGRAASLLASIDIPVDGALAASLSFGAVI
jgi:hypothetical protein